MHADADAEASSRGGHGGAGGGGGSWNGTCAAALDGPAIIACARCGGGVAGSRGLHTALPGILCCVTIEGIGSAGGGGG